MLLKHPHMTTRFLSRSQRMKIQDLVFLGEVMLRSWTKTGRFRTEVKTDGRGNF